MTFQQLVLRARRWAWLAVLTVSLAVGTAAVASASAVGAVHGATAMQPSAEQAPAPSPYIERDPSVNKSLLLRLIAGVRGL